jgi:hypothetical protein
MRLFEEVHRDWAAISPVLGSGNGRLKAEI